MTSQPLQRTHGLASVTYRRGALAGLRQQGSAKAITLDGPVPEVVFLNTAGGLTGGDKLSYTLEVDSGTVKATTQTAERAYRSADGVAQLDVRLTARGQSRIDWLPQETILYQDCALTRQTQIMLDADASCLVLETLVLGRKAMGEDVTRLALRDHRVITRAGKPVLVEPVTLDAQSLHGTALVAGHRVIASLALIAPNAADLLGPVRAALEIDGVVGAASALPGRLMVRLMAADNWPLRQQVAALLHVLSPGPLPRVWQV